MREKTNWDWKQPLHFTRRILAKHWLKFNPQVTIVGITGSYGKTNTTRAITQVLAEKYRVLQTDINLDTIYNLPITILKLRPSDQILVLEYGIDHPGEMDYHLSLVKPQIGVLTGVTPVHCDKEHLGSFDNLIKEKGKLLKVLPKDGLAILNWDDEQVRKMAGLTQARVLWYGSNRERCHWWIAKVRVDFSGTEFEIGNKIGNKKRKVKTRLIGRHFGHAVLVAVIIGDWLGLSWGQIKEGLNLLVPLKGRMSLEDGPMDTILLNDSLRANPASTLAGLQTLADLPAKRKIAVLGEMGELGDYAIKSHRRVGQKAGELKINYLVGVGPLPRYSIKAAKQSGMSQSRLFWAKDVQEAARQLKRIIRPGDLLYLKGSLLRHMERAILLLEGKKVCCRKVVCDRYHSCVGCPRLQDASMVI